MAFLDDIGKAFTNAGQKTKDMADIAKFNSLLAEEEKKINSIFYQIGKTYVQLHPQDYEEPLSAYIQAYQEAVKQTEELKKSIKQLRNIIDCPGCGAEIPGDIAFCSTCGYRLPQKAVVIPDGMSKCVNCGAIVPQHMKFCTGCGAPMQISAPVQAGAPVTQTGIPAAPAAPVAPPVAPVAPVAPSAPVVPPVSPVAVCSNCKSPLEPDCAFCVVCGTPVGGNAPAAPVQAAASSCPNCGAALEADSVFCIECGTKIQ